MKLLSVYFLLAVTIGVSLANPTDIEAKLARLRLDPDYDEAFNEIIAEPKKKMYVMPYELIQKFKQSYNGQNIISKHYDYITKSTTTTTTSPTTIPSETTTDAPTEYATTIESEIIVNQEEDGFLAAHSRVRSIVLAMTTLMRNFFNSMH